MMAAATLHAPGGTEVIWWAGLSHGIPAPVAGAFLSALVAPEPVIRPANGYLRPDLLPLLTTNRTASSADDRLPPHPTGGIRPNRRPRGR